MTDSEAVCAFVSSDVGEEVLRVLHERGVKLVLMRCAGSNNVDLEAATRYGIKVMRVPGYSPEAVAEHAMALAAGCKPSSPQSLCEGPGEQFSVSRVWWA